MRLAIRFSPQRGIKAGSQNTIAQELIPALAKLHPNIVLFTARPEIFSHIRNLQIVPTRGLYPNSIPSMLKERVLDQLTFEKMLVKNGCDVIYYPYTHEAILYARRIPQIITVHDMIPVIYPGMFPLMSKQWKYFTIPCLRRAAKIITVSENTRNDVLRFAHLSTDKVHVVSNGFRPAKFIKPDNNETPKYGRYVLYVSSSQYPYKNITRLISAYAKICETIPHNLVIVGKTIPRFSNEITVDRDNCRCRNRIYLLEELANDELEKVYSRAELFVYPSLYEGFGIPPLEAMNFGIPVAASTAASIPEVCGEAAYYFDPNSEDDMSSAISHCLNDIEVRKKLVASGNKRLQYFTWDCAARKILDICEDAANKDLH